MRTDACDITTIHDRPFDEVTVSAPRRRDEVGAPGIRDNELSHPRIVRKRKKCLIGRPGELAIDGVIEHLVGEGKHDVRSGSHRRTSLHEDPSYLWRGRGSSVTLGLFQPLLCNW